MCNFRVGQKVVCINGEIGSSGFQSSRPGLFGALEEGKVYTVERVYRAFGAYMGKYGEHLCLELAEVKKTPSPMQPRCNGYAADRFRPVAERKTDISIFKAMLNTTPETAGAA